MKNLIQNISVYSALLPILIFLVLSFNRKEKLKWVIFLFISISLPIDIIGVLLARKAHNSVWLVNLFTLIEFCFLTYFFSLLNIQYKKISSLIIALFSVFWVIQNFIVGSIMRFDYISQTIEFLFLLLYCILYYFNKAKVTETIFIYNTYQFWLVSAILIYCAGTFFSFFTPINNNTNYNDVAIFEYISRFGSIIKNILISVAFCINPDKLLKNQPNKNSMYYIKDLKD